MLLLYGISAHLAYGVKKIKELLKLLDLSSHLNNQITVFTQVLWPCSLVMENMVHTSGVHTVAVTIEELTIKVRLLKLSLEEQLCFLRSTS